MMNDTDKAKIKDVLESTITVGELKEILDTMNDESPVVFLSNYGDYCNTLQVHPFQQDEVDTFNADYAFRVSPYSASGVAFNSDDDTTEVESSAELKLPEVVVFGV